jgi:hypothetical protein
MVYLVVANGNHSYSQGFKAGAAMDATVFAEKGVKSR